MSRHKFGSPSKPEVLNDPPLSGCQDLVSGVSHHSYPSFRGQNNHWRTLEPWCTMVLQDRAALTPALRAQRKTLNHLRAPWRWCRIQFSDRPLSQVAHQSAPSSCHPGQLVTWLATTAASTGSSQDTHKFRLARCLSRGALRAAWRSGPSRVSQACPYLLNSSASVCLGPGDPYNLEHRGGWPAPKASWTPPGVHTHQAHQAKESLQCQQRFTPRQRITQLHLPAPDEMQKRTETGEAASVHMPPCKFILDQQLKPSASIVPPQPEKVDWLPATAASHRGSLGS